MRHFQPYELVSRSLFEARGDDAIKVFAPVALEALDDLREYFGVPIAVNNWHSGGPFEHRGARSLTEEMSINPGHGHSRHIFGLVERPLADAFDLDVQGFTAEAARVRILANKDNPLLCKITRLESGVSWVHFDTMPLPAGVARIHLFKA